MRIRTQFAAMVVGITMIPALLLGLGSIYITMNQSQDPVPAYSELPPESLQLTNQVNWSKVRDILVRRPRHAETVVFDDSFRLIFSSFPFPKFPPGKIISKDAVWELLRISGRSQDVFLFQPAGTKVWITLVLDSRDTKGDPLLPILWFGITALSLILLTTIGFAIVMGGNLTQSTVLLEKAVRKLADGDLETRVDIQGNDEVRDLGRSFDQLRVSLQEENARQSRFVMGVSHDLKSPLAVIKGYAELLRDGPVLSPELRENHFELILDRVDQLDSMIEHLIDYGKVNTGEWQQTWIHLPLREFLTDLNDEMAPDARLLGRTLVTDIALTDESVACDRRSIHRCFENLVNNALRYTRPGGHVGITARRVANLVEVTVWDDGPGISAEDLPHLFELFYRGSHSRREPGMGLGLAVVKTILDSHGWSIRAESGSGARFVVTISV